MGFIGVQPASVPLTASDIEADIINSTHIGDTAISGFTALAEAPADTDEFLISDGGVLKRIDASHVGGGFDITSITGQTDLAAVPDKTDEIVINDGGTLKRIDYNFFTNHNSPFLVYKDSAFSSSQSINANTTTTVTAWDDNGTVNTSQQSGTVSSTISSNGRFTPNMKGYYLICCGVNFDNVENGIEVQTKVYSSHDDDDYIISRHNTGGGGSSHGEAGAIILTANDTSYFQIKVRHSDGAGSRNVTSGNLAIIRLPTKDLP